MNRFFHRLLASISLSAALFSAAPGYAAPKFLPPQEAFQFDARALDERTVEVRFTAADGYYLYGDRFAFDAAEPATQFGRVQLPAGKIKFDDTFSKDVETHRGRIVIRLPVTAAPATFTLSVTSQGCADAGLCYPPQKNTAQVSLTGFANMLQRQNALPLRLPTST